MKKLAAQALERAHRDQIRKATNNTPEALEALLGEHAALLGELKEAQRYFERVHSRGATVDLRDGTDLDLDLAAARALVEERQRALAAHALGRAGVDVDSCVQALKGWNEARDYLKGAMAP